ncbi:MAG: hypothetical protein KJ747_07380 [Actinobacteria bacterium]|nr:hypothetical protein [Actinomycetota bacterium]
MTIWGLLARGVVAVAGSAVASLAIIRNWPERKGVLIANALVGGSVLAFFAGIAGSSAGSGEMRPLGASMVIAVVLTVYLFVWGIRVGFSPATAPVRVAVCTGIVAGFIPCLILVFGLATISFAGSF